MDSSTQTLLAGGIFVAAFVLIATERVDRTIIALLGGGLVILLGLVDQADAFAAVDLGVILLLAGMMVIAGGLARTGAFEWLALRAVRLADARPFRLLVLLALITAGLSAILDNVTTVILLTPVVLTVARTLAVRPLPYLLTLVFASNVGGTATLIGDPPNLLIGSAAGLDFGAFLVNLAPVAALALVATLAVMWWAFGRTMAVGDAQRTTALAIDPAEAIRDRPLLAKSLAVLALTMVGFVLHGVLHVEAATIALLGAALLMLIAPLDPHDALREVEWSTLAFFVGLFILVEAVVRAGIVGAVAEGMASASGHDLRIASLGLLWVSAGASAVVDNIPYTAAAIPVVRHLASDGIAGQVLWWALALGACLGGNLTVVGASVNIVVANLAARDGHPIGFREFLRYGAPVTLATLAVATAYLWLRYLA